MTTESIFGVAGPFSDTPGNRLTPLTEYALVDKVTGQPIILPAGNIVTELAVRRKADAGDIAMDLTPGRGIAVGLNGNARVLIRTPGVITDELNSYDPLGDPYTHFATFDTSTNFLKLQQTSHVDRTIVLQAAFGGNVIQGGLSVIVKYKPFSESIAKRFG